MAFEQVALNLSSLPMGQKERGKNEKEEKCQSNGINWDAE